MANILSRLVGPANLGAGTNASVGTVPATHTWTIKHLRIVNNTAAAISVKVGIGGLTDAKLIVQNISIPTGETYVENMQATMYAAETLQAFTSASGLTITANGIDQN